MTNSAATYTRNIIVDFPDWAGATVYFYLRTYFAAAGSEGFPKKEYALLLNGTGQGAQALPVPDNTGDAAWAWRVKTPDNNNYGGGDALLTLAYGSDLQLTAWLAAAQSGETPASLDDFFVLKTGDTMAGQLEFSGTDHAGIVHISLTTTQRDALTPVAGMVIWNTTTEQLEQCDGADWGALGGGAGGGAAWGDITGTLSNQTDLNTALGGKLPLAGGTMTGKITLDGNPSAPNHATNKAYTDSVGAAINLHAAATIGVHGISDTAKLNVIAGLTWAANSIIRLTGTGTAAVVTLAAHVWTFLQSATTADARTAIGAASAADLTAHEEDVANPHQVTAAQVGAVALAPQIVAVSSGRDLALSDAGKILECDGTFTMNCPDGLNIQCTIVNVGTGTITLSATTTLTGDGTLLETQYTGATVYHAGSNVWRALGRLT